MDTRYPGGNPNAFAEQTGLPPGMAGMAMAEPKGYRAYPTQGPVPANETVMWFEQSLQHAREIANMTSKELAQAQDRHNDCLTEMNAIERAYSTYLSSIKGDDARR